MQEAKKAFDDDLFRFDLRSYFDRIQVLNLVRRPDRLSEFFRQINLQSWPFKIPEVFEAIDGSRLPVPYNWKDGGGAWGCMQSHRHVLERAIIEGVESLLVLEDDAAFKASFAADAVKFLRNVPSDWDGLMLGGQSFDARLVMPGIRRCFNCQRTHAYAVRGQYMRDLYQHWCSTSGHCDHRMGEIQSRYKIYAPEPFLVGQTDGRSDISGSLNPIKFWIPPGPDAPVILLRVPQDILPSCRRVGFHTGHRRDPATDIDIGLEELFLKSEDEWLFELRRWIDMIQWEAASMDRTVCTIWHPKATVELLRAATSASILEISASTSHAAAEAIARQLENARASRRPDLVVLMRGPKPVIQRLRGSGFHMGYWRDIATDVDNGLNHVFEALDENTRLDRLRGWLLEVGKEAQDTNAALTIWHPQATVELVKRATKRIVAEIDAPDVNTALRQWRALLAESLTPASQ